MRPPKLLSFEGILFVLVVLTGGNSLRASSFDESIAVGWSGNDDSVIVARGGATPSVTAFGSGEQKIQWSISGVPNPASIAFSDDGLQAAVLDPLHDLVQLVSTRDGASRQIATAETPVAALFDESRLFILCRDGRTLMRISAEGEAVSLELPPDSTLLRSANRRLYVYSRRGGQLTEIDPQSMRIERSMIAVSSASDFEVDRDFGYLVVPTSGEIVIISLSEWRSVDRIIPGAVPTDLALSGGGGVLNAGILVTADPASRAVWRGERSQSGAAAFGRGFVRGLLGLGLFKPGSNEYPTGVDRVWAATWGIAAHDASSGTLYLLRDGKGRAVVSGIPASAIAVTSQGIMYWDEREKRVVVLPPP